MNAQKCPDENAHGGLTTPVRLTLLEPPPATPPVHRIPRPHLSTLPALRPRPPLPQSVALLAAAGYGIYHAISFDQQKKKRHHY